LKNSIKIFLILSSLAILSQPCRVVAQAQRPTPFYHAVDTALAVGTYPTIASSPGFNLLRAKDSTMIYSISTGTKWQTYQKDADTTSWDATRAWVINNFNAGDSLTSTGDIRITFDSDNNGSGAFRLFKDGIEKLRLTNGSKLGLITTSPDSVLTVAGSGHFTTNFRIDGLAYIGTGTPNAGAILELSSVSKAFIPPRMTTAQRNAITAANGMLLYNSTTGTFQGYQSGTWQSFAAGGAISWSSLLAPVDTTYFISNSQAKLLIFDFQGERTGGSAVTFQQSDSALTGSTLFDIHTSDPDIIVFQATSEGTDNGVRLDGSGQFYAIGTGVIDANSYNGNYEIIDVDIADVLTITRMAILDSAMSDGSFVNGELQFWFDDTNDEIEVKGKTHNGQFINLTLGASGGGGASDTTEYVFGRMTSSAQSSNLTSSDHIKWDTLISSYGNAITLDISSSYSTTNDAASIGRFTINETAYYEIRAVVRAQFVSNSDNFFVFTIANATTGSEISYVSRGFALGTDGVENYYNTTNETLYRGQLISGTKYEIKIYDAQDLQNISTDGTFLIVTKLTGGGGGGGGGGAPTDVNYLVGTADATLTNEIVVGTTPGGELGGTWASPTIDADAVGWNEIGDPNADAIIAMTIYETDFTSTLDAAGKAILTIINTDADAANDNSFLELRHNDGADANVFYMKMIGDNDGTPISDFILSQTVFTIGSGITTTFNGPTTVPFADTDNNWTATTLGGALEELDNVINGGFPNSSTGKVDWSQLVNVPSGFADNSDDGAGGGGGGGWTDDGTVVRLSTPSDRIAIGATDVGFDVGIATENTGGYSFGITNKNDNLNYGTVAQASDTAFVGISVFSGAAPEIFTRDENGHDNTIIFDGGDFYFQGRGGINVAYLDDITAGAAANYLLLRNSTTNPALIAAGAGATNADLNLTPKGTGDVRISQGGLLIPTSGTVSTTIAGQLKNYNNAWGSSKSVFQSYDGAASVYLVGVQTSDTPANGQTLKWNTGGTITWEDDNTTAGGSGAPTDVSYLVLSLSSGLSNERAVVSTTNEIATYDGGANGNFAIGLYPTLNLATKVILNDTVFVLEGATADAFETHITIADPSSDNNIAIPNNSGTLAVTASSPLSLSATGVVSLGTVAIANGGTNITSYSQGDLLYASGSNTLTALAKSASATRYLSNMGTSNNPAWMQINLVNGVTGTLPLGNGGTGVTSTPSNGQLLIGNGSGYTVATLTDGSNGIDITNAAGSITPSFDATELGNLTWGSGSGIAWTFNASAGTDPTLTFGDNTIKLGNGQKLQFASSSSPTYSIYSDNPARMRMEVTDALSQEMRIINTSGSAFDLYVFGNIHGWTGQFDTPLSVGNGGTGTATSTGSGSVVLGTSPTLATPTLTLATSSSTSEGRISWDATNNYLEIGDGSAAKPIRPSYSIVASKEINLTSASSSIVFTANTSLKCLSGKIAFPEALSGTSGGGSTDFVINIGKATAGGSNNSTYFSQISYIGDSKSQWVSESISLSSTTMSAGESMTIVVLGTLPDNGRAFLTFEFYDD